MAQDSNMTWDQVQADPRYQKADAPTKYKIEQAWRAAQAPTPSEQPASQPQPTSAPTQPTQPEGDLADTIGNNIANFGQGAVAGFGHSIGQGIGGLVKMGEDVLGTNTTYGKRMLANTERQYQQDMSESGKAGQYGATVGQVAGDIGAMVVAPEVAIPAMAARETGRAYANQKPGEESAARAFGVGTANYIAGRILPGATGEVAETMLGKGIQAAKNVYQGAKAGAAGGGLVGMAETYNENPDATVGQMIGGGLRGATTGAAFGGGISAVHSGIGAVSNRTSKAASDVTQDIPPVEKADLTQEAAAVGEAQTPQQRADAYKAAPGLRSVKGSTALDARGIPLTDSRFAYSPDAAAAHGVSPEQVQTSRDASREAATNAMTPWTNSEAPGKMAVAKEQWERGGRQLVNDVKGSLDNSATTINDFKNTIQEHFDSNASDITVQEKQARTEEMAAINKFQKDFLRHQRNMNGVTEGESIRSENILDDAAKAQESYDNLPDYFKQYFDENFKDIGEGFQKGFNPVDQAATYTDAFSQLKSMHPGFRNTTTNPTQGAVKGVQGTSLTDLGSAALKAFRARGARNKMVAEQERSASNVRSLAAGLANAERRTSATVENARANMEEPVVNDGTQDQMKYSDETPVTEPTIQPQPDQGLVGTPRRPAPAPEPEPVVEPTTVTEEPAPAPSPDQVMTQAPRQPAQPEPIAEPAPEPVPETPAPSPDQVAVRQPTRPTPVEEPVVEPAPAVEPERLPTQAPRRPAEPEPVVEEPAPTPEPEPVVQPEPDQGLVSTPRRPVQEEPAPREEPTEAPTEPSEPVKAEPDQALARTPKAPETPAEAVIHESAEPEPKTKVEPKDATAHESFLARTKARAIDNVKKLFSIKSVQDKVNENNYNDKRAIQRLKREDVAANTDEIQHAVDQLAVKQRVADQRKHENNVDELERWAKANDIDYKFVTQAIEQKGLQKSMILGVNDIKTRATKAAVEDAKPAKIVEKKEEVVPKDWKEQINEFRVGLKDINTDARAKSAQMIEQAFQASQKTGRPLTDSDIHGLWQKIYNHEAEVLTKAGKAKEAAEAKALAEKSAAEKEAKAKTKKAEEEAQAQKEVENQKIKNALKLGEQTDEIHSQIHKQLEKAGLSKEQAEEFASNYMDDNFGVLESPMGDTKYNSNRAKAIEAARKYGNEYKNMNPAEKVEAIHGADETTEKAKKVFEEVGDRLKSAEKDKNQIEDDLTAETIDRAEAVFNEGKSAADVEAAADELIKAYNLDATAAHSIRQYPKVLSKAHEMREKYPDNPEVWLSATDVNNLAKSGRVNADGLKAKITDTVLGKRYDSVKLLTEAEANQVRARLDAGESLKIKIDTGRKGALAQATEQAKKTVKMKPRTNTQRFGVGKMPPKKANPKPNEPTQAPKTEVKPEPAKKEKATLTPEQQAIKKQQTKIKSLRTRLGNDKNYIHDDEYGTKWKSDQARLREEEYKLTQMKKGK